MTHARHLLFLLFFILAAAPLVAQQPSFPIERVEVRGVRFASDDVVARESLVVPGRTYTESELRAAMLRINRLPFVLDSTFALEKGSEHGTYVLVVTIIETKPLFVEAELGEQRFQGQSSDYDLLSSGVRLFVGSSSLLHAATNFEGSYEAGLTQYNLFGRPGFISLSVRWTENSRQPIPPLPGMEGEAESELDPSPQLRFGFPIFGDHSIQGRWLRGSYKQTDTYQGTPRVQRSVHDVGELAWVFDTTDDPVLPTSGTLWRSGLTAGQSRWDDVSESMVFDSDRDVLGVFSSFERHRPLNEWVSVEYGLELAADRAWHSSRAIALRESGPVVFPDHGYATDAYGWAPMIGASTSLWPDRMTRKLGDLRLGTRLRYVATEYDAEGPVTISAPDATTRFETAIVQRSVWGTLRLAFTYIEEHGR